MQYMYPKIVKKSNSEKVNVNVDLKTMDAILDIVFVFQQTINAIINAIVNIAKIGIKNYKKENPLFKRKFKFIFRIQLD